MKNHYVIVETKRKGTNTDKHRVAQVLVTGLNKLLIGYEWGKITAKYTEEFFDSHLTTTKDEMREFQEDPSPFMISESMNDRDKEDSKKHFIERDGKIIGSLR